MHLPDKKMIIETFVKNFVQKNRVERALFELTNLGKRHSFADRLNHHWEALFKMQTLATIEKNNDFKEKILELLNAEPDESCYVISNYGELDDAILPFGKAYDEISARGFASLLINLKADAFLLITIWQPTSTIPFVNLL
jgi:hypothetical protein